MNSHFYIQHLHYYQKNNQEVFQPTIRGGNVVSAIGTYDHLLYTIYLIIILLYMFVKECVGGIPLLLFSTKNLLK